MARRVSAKNRWKSNRSERANLFPTPPVTGTARLVPITSWRQMHCEMELTGVEFDEFWHESVNEGVAYFFKWLGEPRGTVLTVFSRAERVLTVIEAHKLGDIPMSPDALMPILSEVTQLFREAGFWPMNSPGNGSALLLLPACSGGVEYH